MMQPSTCFEGHCSELVTFLLLLVFNDCKAMCQGGSAIMKALLKTVMNNNEINVRDKNIKLQEMEHNSRDFDHEK